MSRTRTLAVLMALLMAPALLLAGCNTLAGAGQDIENTGAAVQDTARDAQDELD